MVKYTISTGRKTVTLKTGDEFIQSKNRKSYSLFSGGNIKNTISAQEFAAIYSSSLFEQTNNFPLTYIVK